MQNVDAAVGIPQTKAQPTKSVDRASVRGYIYPNLSEAMR